MKFVFTKHAEHKLSNLKVVGIKVTKKKIREVINKPDHLEQDYDYPNLIASAKLDVDRVIRVVYRIEKKRVIIITFYPAKKGRYYNES